MTKTEIKKITGLINKIEKSKTKIAAERDKLNDIYYDLECVLSSVDEGIDALELGCIDIRGALDEISKYL